MVPDQNGANGWENPSQEVQEVNGTATGLAAERGASASLPGHLMAAPSVLDRFDKSLQEFLKQGPIQEIQRGMTDLKMRVGYLKWKRKGSPINVRNNNKKTKIIGKWKWKWKFPITNWMAKNRQRSQHASQIQNQNDLQQQQS